MAEGCGLNAVALHARTREQGYSGNARWDWIAAVKDAVKIPVIGNGDIRKPEDACAMVAQSKCDAVMIGRMAPANPWIFRQIEQYGSRASLGTAGEGTLRPAQGRPCGYTGCGNANSGAGPADVGPDAPVWAAERSSAISRLYDEPTDSDRYQMIRTYFRMLIEEQMPGAAGKMKQFASWFTHGVAGGAALRKAIYESKSEHDILARVEEFFERILQPVPAPLT
jgi:tRNA-dihydrouridine synthase